MKSAKLAVVSRLCVACGCCEKVCLKGAIAVDRGLSARVDDRLCIGCGKCLKACPADVIDLVKREVSA